MKSHNIRAIASVAAVSLAALCLSQVDPRPKSTSDLLSLSGEQRVRIGQLWEYASGIRLEQDLRLAKSRPDRIDRDRESALSKAKDAFLTANREATKLLHAGQIYLMEKRAAELALAPEDVFKRMLVWRPEQCLEAPLDTAAAERWLRDRDAYRKGGPQFARQTNGSALGSYYWFGYGFGGHRWLSDHHFDGNIHHHGHSSATFHIGGSHHQSHHRRGRGGKRGGRL